MYVVFAWGLSHNFMGGVGMKSDGPPENEDLKRQKNYANMVFKKIKTAEDKDNFRWWPILRFALGLIIFIGLALIPYE